MPTLTTMGHGKWSRNTARFGIPRALWWIGFRIASAIGHGLVRGDGRGWKMSLGASVSFTTDDGFTSASLGVGSQDHMLWRQCMLLRWSRLSAGLASRS